MLSTIFSLSSLFISFGILCLGHGLNNTLLGVRATLEDFPDWVTGLMMSGYFLGFIFGTHLCTRLLPRIGQIRTFAAFASVASAISLFHVLYINVFTWVLLRIVYGVCIAALYMVIESWLNTLATRENRGQVLSIYMIVSFLSLSLGQLFILLAEPREYQLFAVVSILVSVSLVPLTLSKVDQPAEISSEHFGFLTMYRVSPLATIGIISTGLTLGAFWGLGAVYFTRMGLPSNDVALVIGITFIGGLLFQWPIGYCSDLFDRRITIAAVLLISILICLGLIFSIQNTIVNINALLILLALFFGGFSYTLYSLYLALANDFLTREQVVKASASLITFHAMGAILGPTLASVLMSWLGNNSLFGFIVAINGFMFVFALVRVVKGREIPAATSEPFISLPRSTTTAVFQLDPRQDEHASEAV